MTPWLFPLLTSVVLLAPPDQAEAFSSQVVPSQAIQAEAIPTEAASSEAVQSGRKALDHWGRYPWYDAKSDDLEPLDVSPPWWANLFPDFQVSSGGSRLPETMLQWVAWGAIVLILAVLIYVAIRTYLARRQGGAAAASSESTAASAAEERRRVEALPLPAAGRPLDLLAAAEEQYRLGHYGQAMIYLFSYQLVQLDKHQQIHLTRGKTNRQYLRELGSRPTLRRLFEQTMVAFEDAFFGHHSIDQGRFESCWVRLHEFESLTAEGPR